MELLKRLYVKLVTGALLSVCSAFVLAAEPVAMVTDLSGGAHLGGANGAKQLNLLTYLPPGEEIVLDAGSQLVITYFDESTEFAFKGPALIVIQPKMAKVKKGASASIRKLDQEKTAGAARFARSGKLAFATVEMRAIAVKPTLLSPVNSKIGVVSPLFSWKSVNEAQSYLFVLSEEGKEPVYKETVSESSLKLPDEVSLKPGTNYVWSVEETLKTGDKMTSKAAFTVADEEVSARVLGKQPSHNARFSDKVTYAIFLESEGFRGDAKNLWRELSAQRPDDPNLKFRAR